MKSSDIYPVLSGLKLLESHCTTVGNWAMARKVGRLHRELQKQVFDYSPKEDDTDE